MGFIYLSSCSREDNVPWNSNIIVERVSNMVVKTVSGRVYILVGKMKINVESGRDVQQTKLLTGHQCKSAMLNMLTTFFHVTIQISQRVF